MCGIFGVVGRIDESDARFVRERMGALLRHRGPDESGVHVNHFAAVGMCRLSIVDLSGGTQPISNEDGTVWVVFNGEIYNYRALRDELMIAGHVFSTQTDTEVIVHGYEQWGDDVVAHLSGMFGFAIVDERRKRVLIARDHLGKKPVYLHENGGRLFFASEPKAILAHSGVSISIDPLAAWDYLTFKNVPAPSSIYQRFTQLPQGSLAVFEDGKLSIRAYDELHFSGDLDVDEQTAAREVLARLRAAVESRMVVADVPVGAYLSGGLDSSLIVALAAEAYSEPINTFSLGYASPVAHKTDVGYARAVAKRFGTKHHELFLTVADVVAALPRIVEAFDEPFGAGTSPYYLSELIARHVKVALTGDGADELFGSYAPHRAAAAIEAIRNGDHDTPFSSFFGDADLARRSALEPDHVWRTRFAAFSDIEKAELVVDAQRFRPSSDVLKPFFAQAHGDLVNRTLEVECRTLLPDQILTYVDRLSMAHSVETRSPFLDRRVVAYAGRLPGSLKVRVDATKSVLKTAARAVLPDEIIDRPKEGFILPIDVWLANDMLPLLREVTSRRWLTHGLFAPDAVARFVDEHVSGARNHTYKLWTLLMFQLWFARYVEGRDLREVTELCGSFAV